MGRDEDIEAIARIGRQTRKPNPRWLWIAAAVVGAICATCFMAMVLGDPAPARPPVVQRPAVGSGLGIGLVIGAGAGILIGFSIGRQRRSHSSRNSP